MTFLGHGRVGPIIRERTGLLIIDVQKGICDLARELEDGYFARAFDEVVIPNVGRLQRAARTARMEVIFTVIRSLTADGRDRSLDYKLTGYHFPPGSVASEVVDAIRPAPDEIVLPKSSSSLFNSTTFEYVIRNIGIDSVIVTGFQTDQCIDHTIRDGADRGFAMVCATDACTTESLARHENALRAFKGYCRLATTAELIAEIEGSAT